MGSSNSKKNCPTAQNANLFLLTLLQQFYSAFYLNVGKSYGANNDNTICPLPSSAGFQQHFDDFRSGQTCTNTTFI